MATLTTHLKQLDKTAQNVEKEAYRIIAAAQKEITALNTNEQLYKKGIDAEGRKLKPDYSRVRYARAKHKFNPLPGYGTPDLKLTGSFYKQWYLVARNKQIEFFSSDAKADKLQDKYGENIFGLTSENERLLNEEILLPRLVEWLLKIWKI